MPIQSLPELRFKAAMRCENVCASGSAVIFAAIDFIRSGRGRIALVIGAEKMTAATGAEADDHLLGASYLRHEDGLPAGFAVIFGRIADSYFQRYGDRSEALTAIAAKNHRSGVDNPLAHLRKDLGFDFCRTVSERNPLVSGPLRCTDCSPVYDGAAALVLADGDTAAGLGKAVFSLRLRRGGITM